MVGVRDKFTWRTHGSRIIRSRRSASTHYTATKLMTAFRPLITTGKTKLIVACLCLTAAGPASLQAQALDAATTSLSRADNIQLPTLGDGSEIRSSAERSLGDRIAREIYRDPDYVDDPVLSDYVQSIWQPLLDAARLRGDLTPELHERFAWRVMLIRDRTVNAFALPGGYFGIHLGLLAVVGNRDELASVLGHELSHVTQRHIARVMAKQTQQTPWMIGAMILGALAATKSPDAASALIVGGQAAAIQNQLNFSRDMEREADRVGFGIMTQAGFEAHGFLSMFEKLQQASRLNDNGAYPYLRSHPLTTERIADMQTRQPLTATGASSIEPSIEHAMMMARARVLSNPGVDVLRAIASEDQGQTVPLATPARQAEVWYGASLAAVRLREFPVARRLLGRLSEIVRTDPQATRLARLLEIEVELGAGGAERAAGLLRRLRSDFGRPGGAVVTGRRPELLVHAQVAVGTGHSVEAQQAAQDLQSWVLAHPHDMLAWQSLSGVYAAQGQMLRAIRADAEAQAARLDYAAALDRLRAAQELVQEGVRADAGKAVRDHIEASIIDTRKRQLESTLKEQALNH